MFSQFVAHKHAPVLDVSFPTTQSWGVNCECNCLEASPFSSSDELCNHIPILVDLPTGKRPLTKVKDVHKH